jgi:hypothetical protein
MGPSARDCCLPGNGAISARRRSAPLRYANRARVRRLGEREAADLGHGAGSVTPNRGPLKWSCGPCASDPLRHDE